VSIKFLFPINKQFSIDSCLDWEGHYWVFALAQPDHSNVLVIYFERLILVMRKYCIVIVPYV